MKIPQIFSLPILKRNKKEETINKIEDSVPDFYEETKYFYSRPMPYSEHQKKYQTDTFGFQSDNKYPDLSKEELEYELD